MNPLPSFPQDVPVLSIEEETDSPAQKKHKVNEEIGNTAETIIFSDETEKHKANEGDEEKGNSSSSAETTIFSDEDDDLTSSPIVRVCCTDYDPEEDYCPDYPNGKMDKPLWEKYYKQIKESEGFDIEDFPGRCWMTTVFPLPYYLTDPKNVMKLKDYASKALKQYNDSKGTSYEVDEILKVNGGGCRSFIYYITFSVKNGEVDIFQAKVEEEMDYSLEFHIVRPKPKVL